MSTAAAKTLSLSERTLIPVSLVIVLLSGAYWVGSLQVRVANAEAAIQQNRGDVAARLDDQGKTLQGISSHVVAIDAKLSAFIEFYKDNRAISPHK